MLTDVHIHFVIKRHPNEQGKIEKKMEYVQQYIRK